MQIKTIIILNLIALLSASSFSAQLEDFFSVSELQTMELAGQYSEEYQTVSFSIRQILSNQKALVLNNGNDYILYDDFSNKVDGQTVSTKVKKGKPEKYETVIGSTRTVTTYHAITSKELDILNKNNTLASRRKLVEEELYREKGESVFKEQKKYIIETIEMIDAFLQENSPNYTGEYQAKLKELGAQKKRFEEVIIRQEYHGDPITSESLEELSASLKILKLQINREKKDVAAQEALLAKQREEKANEEAQKKETDALKREKALQDRLSSNKIDEALFEEWLIKTSTCFFLVYIEDEFLRNKDAYWTYRDAKLKMKFIYSFNKNSDWDIGTKNRQRSSIEIEEIDAALKEMKTLYPDSYFVAESVAPFAKDRNFPRNHRLITPLSFKSSIIYFAFVDGCSEVGNLEEENEFNKFLSKCVKGEYYISYKTVCINNQDKIEKLNNLVAEIRLKHPDIFSASKAKAAQYIATGKME